MSLSEEILIDPTGRGYAVAGGWLAVHALLNAPTVERARSTFSSRELAAIFVENQAEYRSTALTSPERDLLSMALTQDVVDKQLVADCFPAGGPTMTALNALTDFVSRAAELDLIATEPVVYDTLLSLGWIDASGNWVGPANG